MPFIIANANEDRFRRWATFGGFEWTSNKKDAIQFGRRRDADAVAAEDEDAWKILEVPGDEFGWLIEAPGLRYLCARTVPSTHGEFVWTLDHNQALRFVSEVQATKSMMAIREMNPALFGFETTLGNARAVEHGWMATEAA